ncbi:hypothetical protein Poli38472_014550 [Pythium oligandrum]|uniref:SAM domain-containing protein n=1 Tax=Pythium oligandrum TaxID=41045 RepID=A0A8K1CCX4_PYTOL|nr:hypothetical protein Poli38472_014550 [Pythium oligandrum]|eukprot:TMW61089.1 hypothetical protein Poli38472_014550 [Pythium oligandrum]
MPERRGPPSPTSLSRCEDDVQVSRSPLKTTMKTCKTSRTPSLADDHDSADVELPPTSPRVRKRLDEAKENASVFGPGKTIGGRVFNASCLPLMSSAVCEQGEVIQWMSACHSGLIEFGRDLERRGFKTLSSIAFLTEEDLDPSIEAAIRQHLLATLARLRHEFFRM